MGIKEKFKEILVRQQEVIYENQLATRKVNYQTWVETQEKQSAILEEPSGNAKQSQNSVCEKRAEMSLEKKVNSSKLRIWHAKAGKLNQYALRWIEDYFEANPQIMIAYGDEDVWAEKGKRENPWYKPEWSPDTYKSCFYVGSVIAIRESFAQKLYEQGSLKEKQSAQKNLKDESHTPEGLRDNTCDIQSFENARQLRSWLDKAIELAGGYQKGCKSIGRIPQILFHVTEASVWEEYLQCAMDDAAEELLKSGDTKLSIIIPSKDNPQLLQQCLNSLYKSLERQKDLPSLEIVVVDNGSSSENREQLEVLLKEHTYLYHPMDFNFARMCNMGAGKATGSLYLFLNDDIEFCENSWLEEMLAKATEPYVGAVGLKLYYPNSQNIQHAGITNLPIGPVHKLQGFEDTKSYYWGKNKFQQNCLAVTGACLLVAKEKFDEAGGFEESLQVAYNDVDLCMSLYEAGYQNVCVNNYFAYHHESLTRGSDETPVKQKRLQEELQILQRRHPALVEQDPYYPKQLNHEGLDAGIVPGYHNAFNTKQPAGWLDWSDKIKDVREDACLMVRVEACKKELLQGYSVVLGDNNACYDKYLVLEAANGKRVYMPLVGQYRLDLEENLPDQKNVALGGFCVKNPGENLKAEEYKIGVMAVHRISRLKLLNWSGKALNLCESAE